MTPLVLLFLLQQAATPQPPRILVLAIDGAPANRTFLDLLRIQLASAANVQTDAEPLSGTLPEKVDRALARGADAGAMLTVWIEELPASSHGRDFVLYAVGQKIPRALVEVARLPASKGAAAYRTLAIKLAALLESLLTASKAPPDLARPVVETVRQPEPPDPAASYSLLLEIGAFGASDSGDFGPQAGLELAAGGRLARRSFLLEAYAGARLASELSVSKAAGQLVVREWSVGGGARLLHGDRWLFGGSIEGDAIFVDASGTASDGRTGAVTRTLPTLLAVLEGRLRLSADTQIRGAAGAEIALVEQSFVAAGAPVADLGRARAIGEISFVISLH